MRALRAQDPAELGGHRLVARLGAGGMGVVYLARTGAGELVALKVIRAEYAVDPRFRARFRREARLAAGVRGRWVVRVTDADAEARAPWLATAFVPGPSLAETVVSLGPLPARTVLTLGVRMADALADLHATGLVHRDVKPANILLARDGPRLIDFGIARGAGVTALTAPDAVLGTAGYLAPEQVQAHGEDAPGEEAHGDRTGPASDVFSLGCALAFATTGRAPFGTGVPAVVLYRTVHEEPDLTGLARLPAAAREAIARCLARDPAARPDTAELRDALGRTAALPAPRLPAPRLLDPRLADPRQLRSARAAWNRPRDGRDGEAGDSRGDGVDERARGRENGGGVGGAGAHHGGGRGTQAGEDQGTQAGDEQDAPVGGGHSTQDSDKQGTRLGGGRGGADEDWLPPGVLRLVAAHAARALDPPPREAAPAGAEPAETGKNPAEAGERTARMDPAESGTARPPVRSRRRVLAVGGAAAAVLAAGTGAGVLAMRRTPATAGTPTVTLGLQSAGTEQERGARLAVAAHNARSGARFRLALSAVDDHGRAADAQSAARRLIAAPGVLAVLGPSTEAAVRAAGPLYTDAGMPMVLVAYAGSPSSDPALRTMCVTRVPDDELGTPLGRYLTVVHPTDRTAVIDDRTADRAGSGAAAGLAQSFHSEPPGGGTATVHPVTDGRDIEPAVAEALAGRPDAVVYAGASPDRAAACARALAAAGFDGARVAVEPVMRAGFLRAAGRAADGWVFSAPYADPASMSTAAARAFTAAYRARHHASPGPWAAEAYDAVGLLVRALDALGGTQAPSRRRLADQVPRTSLDGVAKPIRFTAATTHDLDSGRAGFLYQAREGRFRFLGRYDQVEAART